MFKYKMDGVLCPEEFINILQVLTKITYVKQISGLVGGWEV